MYGFSYAGATQLMAATLRPPSLVTVCPALTASQYYEGWTYNQGALALAFTMSWAVNLAGMEARRAKDDEAMASLQAAFANSQGWNWYLPLTEFPPLTGKYGSYFFDWLAHPTYDDYWRRWSIDEDYSRLTIPALHIAGWYDIFLAGSVKNFIGMRNEAGSDAARAGQKLVVGPWTHIPWAPASLTSEGCGPGIVDDFQLRWFDHVLKGEETGVLDAPVTLFVMGAETWRDYPVGHHRNLSRCDGSSIPKDVRTRASATDALAGRARRRTPGPLYRRPDGPDDEHRRTLCCLNFVAPMGPADQRAAEEFNSVLVYTSEPLVEPIELIGDVTVTLYAATSARDTDWTARLCEVHPDGRSINLQEGRARALPGGANRRCWNRSASIATTSPSAPSGCASPLATGYASRSRAAISTVGPQPQYRWRSLQRTAQRRRRGDSDGAP